MQNNLMNTDDPTQDEIIAIVKRCMKEHFRSGAIDTRRLNHISAEDLFKPITI
jgi:hypothetical protein